MLEASQTSPRTLAEDGAALHPAGLKRWQLLLAFYVGVPLSIALIFGWMGATRTAEWDRGLAISYWIVLNFSGWWLTDLCSRAAAVVLRPWNPPLLLVLVTGYLAHGPLQVAAAREIITWFQSHLPPDVVTKPLPTWGLEQAVDNFMPGIVTWFAISFMFYAWLGLPRYGYVYGRGRLGQQSGTPREPTTATPPIATVAANESAARSIAEPTEPVRAPSIASSDAGGEANVALRLPSFLQRVSEEIRAPVIALEAEQHYLRVFTEKGRDLILYRFSDAVAEMTPETGAQVHRSWWVSRAAIDRAVKENGAWRLILKDGTEVPVSRTFLLAARQSGLIEN